MALISVIIPVYNVEKYLKECLDSVLAQTFTDFELILIDDGSTDGSPEICDVYAARDHRVRVFHQENQGQAAARNFAVNQAAADWVAFVDGDDVLHPQYLEALFCGVRKGAKISLCSYHLGDDIPDDFLERLHSFQFEIMEINDFSYSKGHDKVIMFDEVIWRLLVSRDILLRFPFETGRISEDAAIVCSWYIESGKLVLVNPGKALYFYRQNPTGTKKITENTLKKLDVLWAHNQRLSCLKEKGYEETLRVYVHRAMLAAANCYDLFTNDYPNVTAVRIIKQEFHTMEKEYGEYAVLSNDDLEWIMARFHPVRLRIQIMRKKLKEYGPAGFVGNAFKHIRK